VENLSPDEFFELRCALDAQFLRHGLTWKHPRVKAWMQRIETATGYRCRIAADVPAAAMFSLLDKLSCQNPQEPPQAS
jgi:glutathione S-transferase